MRESYVTHSEYIEDLPEEYKNRFLRYIYDYGIHGKRPDLTGLELSLWSKISRRIDADYIAYQTTSIKKSMGKIKYKLDKKDASQSEIKKYQELEKELESLSELKGSHGFPTVLHPYTQCDIESDSVSDIDSDNDIDIDSDIDSESDNDSVVVVVSDKRKTTTKKSFVKPSVEEIKKYCAERYNNIDAEKFFDYYEAKGWKIGREIMTDWKAAIRVWESKAE